MIHQVYRVIPFLYYMTFINLTIGIIHSNKYLNKSFKQYFLQSVQTYLVIIHSLCSNWPEQNTIFPIRNLSTTRYMFRFNTDYFTNHLKHLQLISTDQAILCFNTTTRFTKIDANGHEIHLVSLILQGLTYYNKNNHTIKHMI